MRPIIPVRSSEIVLTDSEYVSSSARIVWEDLALFLVCSLPVSGGLVVAIWLSASGHFWPSALVACLWVLPFWAALGYVVAMAAVQRKVHFTDLFRGLWHYYVRGCLIAVPAALVVALLTLAWPVLDLMPSLWAVASGTLEVLVALSMAALTLYAVSLLAAFDLTLVQAWSYSLALLVHWPMHALGLVSMAFLLVLAARMVGLGAWPVAVVVFVPFQVNLGLLLSKKALSLQS